MVLFAEYFIIYVWSFASKKVDFLKYNLFKVPCALYLHICELKKPSVNPSLAPRFYIRNND
jgi:hypothetical protein